MLKFVNSVLSIFGKIGHFVDLTFHYNS